jgi:periplasmic divalent cation tolerance protein
MAQIVVFITTSGKTEAVKIAKGLLKNKLVACVNIIDRVESFFWWKGKICRAKECLLTAKSSRAKLDKVIKAVRLMHSYEVPEIIAMDIAGGSKTYLDWIDDSIR